MVRYPVFSKSGKFIIFLYPITSTGTNPLKVLIGVQNCRKFLFEIQDIGKNSKVLIQDNLCIIHFYISMEGTRSMQSPHSWNPSLFWVLLSERLYRSLENLTQPDLYTHRFYQYLRATRIMDEKIETIRQYIKGVFNQPGSHGLDHLLRVVYLCEVIGKEENADMRVLLPAALFHDIARPVEKEKGMPHEEVGARMAERYLRSIHYDEERIPKITHAIRTHRYRTIEKPETLEARILSDADKLDAMGAVGIARTFIRAGEHQGEIRDAIDHIHNKLLNLNGLMYTKTAKKMAEGRHRCLCVFLETLTNEITLPGSLPE
jgi:uncharacterized protein